MIRKMQKDIGVWTRRNFGIQKSHQPLLGITEGADAKKARVKIPEMLIGALSKLAKESKKNIIRELKKYENNLEKEGEE